jgi:hypothetical protein
MVWFVSQTLKRVVRPSPLSKRLLFTLSSCQANTKEASRYKPFTRLANTALQAWESLAGELHKIGFPTSPSGGSRLIFQRNDPARVPSVHNGLDLHLLPDDTLRSPDVIAIQLSTATKTRVKEDSDPEGDATTHDWQDHAENFADREPASAPSFEDIFLCFEFKLNKNKLPQVPKIFQDKDISSCRMADPLAYTHNLITFQRAYGSSESSLSSQSSTTVASGTSYNDKGSKTKAGTSGIEKHRKTTSHNSDAVGSKVKQAKKGPFARNQQLRKNVAETHPTHIKDENVKSRKLPASVQSSIYAAERLSSSVAIAHCLNAVIIGSHPSLFSGMIYSNECLPDEYLWLWWYDRGGAVQSYGLDFVTDLPYLLDLFAILAHFDDKAWGIAKDIFPLSKDKQTFRITLNDTEFDIFDSLAPKSLTLFGRATTVCPVKSNDVHPLDPAESLDDEELVAKVYWPENTRTNEKDLLDLAYAIGGQPNGEDVRGHLPVLVASGTFFGQDVDAVKRKKLLQLPSNHQYIDRCLRILIFYKLRPIWELTGKDFLMAWVDCFRCEFCGFCYGNTCHIPPQVTGLCGVIMYTIATSALVT